MNRETLMKIYNGTVTALQTWEPEIINYTKAQAGSAIVSRIRPD